MADYLLGIDAGSTMTKVVLLDAAGRELGCERRRNPILFPAPGHTERDPERMWNDVADATRALLSNVGAAPEAVAAVAVSGYGAGLYLVDAAGRAVRPGIMSTDARAGDVLARWERDGVTQRNALRIRQRLWAGQPPALMAWLGIYEPEVLARTHCLLFCKDYLRARLCGELATDPTDAGVGGLVAVPDDAHTDAFFEELGLAAWRNKMPRIAPATEMAGELTGDAAEATGLRAGTPVVRGVVDVTASALASGVREPTQMSVVAGTFSINSSLHRAPRIDGLPFLQMAYPLGGYCLATEGSATSASNFEWYCKAMLGPEAAAAASAAGRSIYELAADRVAESMNRPNDILFLPFLFGGPGGAPAAFIGLQAAHDGADVVRAIFEGIVFAHKLDIDALLAGRDQAPVRTIRLVGGASRNAVWAQMFADMLGLPVEICEGTEPGARGTAMCAAVALGWHADLDAAMLAMVRVVQVHTPRPEWQERYARKFERFHRMTRMLAEFRTEDGV